MDLLDGYQQVAQDEIDSLRRALLYHIDDSKKWEALFKTALNLAQEAIQDVEVKRKEEFTRRFEMLKVLKDN